MRKSLAFLVACAVLCSTCLAQVAVRGYTRQDGTYVQPYTRSLPGSGINNGGGLSGQSYGTRADSGLGQSSGNLYAPSVRQPAVRNSLGDQPSGIGRTYLPSGNENTSRVQVDGYKRSNGTYVQPYTRTAPNKTDDDNWSTKGNLNLDTGKPGYKRNDPFK